MHPNWVQLLADQSRRLNSNESPDKENEVATVKENQKSALGESKDLQGECYPWAIAGINMVALLMSRFLRINQSMYQSTSAA
jgi:hypothetical protein